MGGATWNFLSKVTADYNQHEPSLVRLEDGKLVMISRPEGTIAWSGDEGKTWSEPVTFGFRMFAPTLLVLADGTLLCHYGSYNHGGLRAIFSSDGGHTWVAADKNRGFLIDHTYGYSRSCLMPDGSAFLAYIGTGGHRRKDAANNMIWSIRLRCATTIRASICFRSIIEMNKNLKLLNSSELLIMTRVFGVTSLIAFCLLTAACTVMVYANDVKAEETAGKVLDIGSDRELFVDRYLIDKLGRRPHDVAPIRVTKAR